MYLLYEALWSWTRVEVISTVRSVTLSRKVRSCEMRTIEPG